MKNDFRFPPEIAQILHTFSQAGFSCYAVGGCVRDALLGKIPYDYDLCTSALPEQTQALFSKTVPTGLAHGTVTVFYGGQSAEVTTFRREGSYTDHRRPDAVLFTTSLEEDLARRDFTMNAIAMDEHYAITDPYGGVQDLEKGLIRCVGDPDRRFREDALRMFRGMRFAAQLGFPIVPETLAAMGRQAKFCSCVAPERLRVELEKTLLSPRPQILEQVIAMGMLSGYVDPQIPVDLRHLAELPKDAHLRYTALTYALLQSGSIGEAKAFLKALRLDNQTVDLAVHGIEIVRSRPDWDRRSIKHLLSRYTPETLYCAASCGDYVPRSQAVEAVLALNEPYSLKQLAVTGRELQALGITGTAVGKTLHKLLDAVICDPGCNTREALLTLAEKEKPDESES